MQNSMGGMKNVCNCPHHKIVPVVIILIGLTFLLGTLGILTMWAVSVIWPVLLMVVGGVKLGSRKCKCC
jgi:uncharacterized membrane protein